MNHVEEVLYLGDIVNGSQNNMSNIKDRVSKGVGIINNIFYILENVCYGSSYFQAAILLRETMLINATIYNGDVWYNINNKEICELNKVDKIFFSRLTGMPNTTPFESYFLEFGCLNIEQYLKGRRIIYFHNLVNREKSQMIYRFLLSQFLKPVKGDWTLQVLQDFKDLEINFDFQWLEKISKNTFKALVKQRLQIFALKQFNNQKITHLKMRYLNYQELKMQDYLHDKNTTTENKKEVLKWRVFMKDFGTNFRGGRNNIPCPLCKTHQDQQKLSFVCPFILNRITVKGRYESIFEPQIDNDVINTLAKISQIRQDQIKK